MRKEFVSYETALALKSKGFKEWTSYCITQYDEDFIYDGDPEHPESHKKGEISVFNFNNKNNDNDKNLASLPTIDETIYWLRKKGYHICFEPSYDVVVKGIVYTSYMMTNNGEVMHLVTIPTDYISCSEISVEKAVETMTHVLD